MFGMIVGIEERGREGKVNIGEVENYNKNIKDRTGRGQFAIGMELGSVQCRYRRMN